MRKKILCSLLLVSKIGFSQSQDLKQLELDIQKLAQLKSMLSEMYRGYSILDKGYGSIKELSQGNYQLHKTYLDQLLAISPGVKSDPKIASVNDQYRQIDAIGSSTWSLISQSTVFTDTEKAAIHKRLQNILTDSNVLIEELQIYTKPGALRMNDAERLQAIERIEKSMKEKQKLAAQLARNTGIYNVSRNQQIREGKQLKSLF